jgi:predicted DNA-binding transcriptional regulator AlpA
MPVNRRRPTVAEPRRRALTPNETAAHTGLTTKELASLRQRGEGPMFIALTRNSIRYLRSSVDEWAARSAMPGNPVST